VSVFKPSLASERIEHASKRPTNRPGPGVVSLALGEPDFDTPRPIVDAAVEALRGGYTHYIDFSGDPELREAIADDVSRIAGERYGADQIFVTHGGTSGISATILAVANPGDKIVIPEPNYSLYADAAHLAGATPVYVPTASDYHLDLERLETALKGARLLVVCNPCNPTGAVYRPDELQRLAEIVERENVLVISDEAYNAIVYDGREFVSLLRFGSLRDRLIYCQTFSKTFAMTGWRSGYLAGPAPIIKAVGFVHRTFNGAPNAVVHRAALAAVKMGPRLAEPMLREYSVRRALMMQYLEGIDGLDARAPEGTFYLFARYRADIPSQDMLTRLLEGGVAVRAGIEYGPTGEHHIRFSFATSPESIREGLARVRTVFEGLPQAVAAR
jgi:aspartate aminotransferase